MSINVKSGLEHIVHSVKTDLESILPSSETDLDKLKKIVSGYNYSRKNIIGGNFRIKYNPEKHQILFLNFFDYNNEIKTGTCGELMTKVYNEIKIEKVLPDYHIIRVEGNDPIFFNNEKKKHCFLLISKQDIMGDAEVIKSPAEIEGVLKEDENLILVDPSFNRVIKFSNSGYTARKLVNDNYHLNQPSFYFAETPRATPLYFTSDGMLYSLKVDPKKKNKFEIIESSLHEEDKYYPLDGSLLDDAPDAVIELIDTITNTRIEKTTDDLKIQKK